MASFGKITIGSSEKWGLAPGSRDEVPVPIFQKTFRPKIGAARDSATENTQPTSRETGTGNGEMVR
jgi:hypothetical protein